MCADMLSVCRGNRVKEEVAVVAVDDGDDEKELCNKTDREFLLRTIKTQTYYYYYFFSR